MDNANTATTRSGKVHHCKQQVLLRRFFQLRRHGVSVLGSEHEDVSSVAANVDLSRLLSVAVGTVSIHVLDPFC